MAETIKKKRKKEPDGFDRFNRVSNTANVLLNVMFILMALVCIIPVLLVIAISLSAEASITEYGYHLIPKIISFEGYEYLAKQSTLIIRALGISLFVTIVGTVLGILLTTLMGYVLSRPGYKLNGFLTMVVFIPMVFNGGLVSTYFITSQFLNLKDSVWALILPLAVSSFNVVICRTFFKTTVPEELIESAKMDGARQFTIFFRIVLPISLPVLATIGLFLCFAYWNDWYNCMLYITNENMFTLQYYLQRMLGSAEAMRIVAEKSGMALPSVPLESMKMAMTVIATGPIVLLYPFVQRYFVKGLTIGAVKG